jgi:hypothetical protein
MATKCYYLFGIRIWTVIDDSDLEEELEETDSTLTVMSQLDNGLPPAFGFTPWSVTLEPEEE